MKNSGRISKRDIQLIRKLKSISKKYDDNFGKIMAICPHIFSIEEELKYGNLPAHRKKDWQDRRRTLRKKHAKLLKIEKELNRQDIVVRTELGVY